MKIDNVLWLIAARSGSKSIPNKNIKRLNGIPLLAYRIRSALSISKKSNVWVSTDSKEYAEISRKFGATIPFIRPVELAQDNSSSMDVVLHAMKIAASKGRNFNFIGLLEPTSPLVFYQDLWKAVKCLERDTKADAIVAVRESRPNTFFIQNENHYLTKLAERIKKRSGKLIRQDFKKQITPSGGFYISKWNSFLKNKSFYTKTTIPYMLPDFCTLEIDEPIDWTFAEFLLAGGKVNKKDIYTTKT